MADNGDSSDDWSSSSEEDEVIVPSKRAVQAKTKSRNVEQASSDSDSDDDDDDDDNSSNSQSDDDSQGSGNSDGNGGKAKDSYKSILPVKEETLTLGEQLSQREEELAQSGGYLKRNKERKAKAREIVAKRLAKFKSGDARKDEDASEENDSSEEDEAKQDDGKIKKKKSKHAPTEVSSKREDFYSRKRNLNESGIGVDIGAHRYKPRDPRMSSLSGHLDEEHFEQNYAFLNEMRAKEIEQLKNQVKARKLVGPKGTKMRRKYGVQGNQGSLEEDKDKLKQLQQQVADMERRTIERNAKRSVKKKLQDDVVTGKQSAAHFLKRRDMKRLVAEAKFDELRKRGGDSAVDKVLAKRRKKNKSRDSKGLGKVGQHPAA